jgi:hypothetical protein
MGEAIIINKMEVTATVVVKTSPSCNTKSKERTQLVILTTKYLVAALALKTLKLLPQELQVAALIH